MLQIYHCSVLYPQPCDLKSLHFIAKAFGKHDELNVSYASTMALWSIPTSTKAQKSISPAHSLDNNGSLSHNLKSSTLNPKNHCSIAYPSHERSQTSSLRYELRMLFI